MAARIPAPPTIIPRLAALQGWAPLAARLEAEREQHRVAGDHAREVSKDATLAALQFQLGAALWNAGEAQRARGLLDAARVRRARRLLGEN